MSAIQIRAVAAGSLAIGIPRQPQVEVVIGGLSFTTDAYSDAHARELVVRTAQALGLDPPCTCEGCVSPALACTCHPSLEVVTGERVFKRTERIGATEYCERCGRHISEHFGGTEYRCDPRSLEDVGS